MERKDEFNTLEVLNEDKSSFYNFEFGKTQKSDFTSAPKDNKTSDSKDEINDSLSSSDEHNDDKKDLSDLLKNKSSGSESEASVQSEAAQNGQAAVETTASAGTAVSGTIAGATVVAVTAVAIVAGVNVLPNEKASCQMEYEVAATEVYGSLQLFTDKEDTGDYIVYCKNETYYQSQPLDKAPFIPEEEQQGSDWENFDPLVDGMWNEFVFEGLNPGTNYELTVIDANPGGRTLFTTVVKTTGESPYLNNIVFGEPDYLSNKLSYHLDMKNNPAGDAISDIKFELYNGNKNAIFALPADNEDHIIDLNGGIVREGGNDDQGYFDLMHDTFSYALSYKMNGVEQETISESGIDFNGGGTYESHIGGLTVSETANFQTYMFTVTLVDYQDDFGIIDTIKVEISDDDHVMGHTYELEPTTAPQQLCGIIDGEVIIDVRTGIFIYTLSYNYYGQPITVESEENFRFTDNSGAVNTFNSVSFANPNYANNTFYMTLDYEEEIEGAFSFYLELTNQQQLSKYIDVDPTTSAQLIDFSADPGETTFDLKTDVLSYTLYIYQYYDGDNEQTSTGTIDFTGGGDYLSEITSVTLSETANFITSEFTVTLDYVDDYNLIDPDGIKLAITDSTGQNGYEYDLELTKDPQTLCGIVEGNKVVDVANGRWTWTLNYSLLDGNTGTLQPTTSDFVFKDNALTISETADFDSYEFNVTLDTNGHSSEYSNFEIIFNNVSTQHSYTVGISEGTNTIAGLVNEEGQNVVEIDVRAGSFSYILQYDVVSTGETTGYSGDDIISFRDASGVVPSAAISFETETDLSRDYAYATIMMTDDQYELLNNFNLVMTAVTDDPDNTPDPFEFELSYLNGVPQKISFDAYYQSLNQQTKYEYVFTYMYKGQEYSDEGTVEFTQRESRFDGLVTNNILYSGLSMASGNYYLPIRYNYVDDNGTYWNSRITIDGQTIDSVTLDHNWQLIEVPSGVRTGVNVNVTVEVQTDSNVWDEVVNETRNFGLNSDSEFFVGASVDDYLVINDYQSYAELSYLYLLYYQNADSPRYYDWYLEFEDTINGDIFTVNFTPSTTSSISGGYSGTMETIDLSAITTTSQYNFLDLVSAGHSFTIKVKCKDSDNNDEIVTVNVVKGSTTEFVIPYVEQI